MIRRPSKTSEGVWYRAPGSDQWLRQADDEERRELRRRARALLAKADVEVRKIGGRSRRRAQEVLGFERDMAAAVGAWERWVEAGARSLVSRSRDVVEDLVDDAREAARKLAKILGE